MDDWKLIDWAIEYLEEMEKTQVRVMRRILESRAAEGIPMNPGPRPPCRPSRPYGEAARAIRELLNEPR